jgi:hypothetical protein
VRRPSRRLLRLSLFAVVATLALWTGVIAIAMASTSSSLPTLDVSSVRSGPDARLSHVASVLAAHEGVVECWSEADWDARVAELAEQWPQMRRLDRWSAYTSPDLLTVHMSPSICLELRKLEGAVGPVWDDDEPEALAWSVSALAHESAHVAGWRNEAVAECYAIQSIEFTTELLGRTRREGRWLAERYVRRFYRYHEPPYTSPECRNGGRLDVRPTSDVWP